MVYARDAGGLMLHTFHSRKSGMPMDWIREPKLRPTQGIICGYDRPDGTFALALMTAPCEADPAMVSVVYVHEIAHDILGHPVEGRLLYFYTAKEEEADVFARGFLYGLDAPACPCSKSLVPNVVTTKIKQLREDDNGFYYGDKERAEDLQLLKQLKDRVSRDPDYDC